MKFIRTYAIRYKHFPESEEKWWARAYFREGIGYAVAECLVQFPDATVTATTQLLPYVYYREDELDPRVEIVEQ